MLINHDMHNQDIPVKIKDKLYPALLELCSNNDYHQVNMREIAAQSEISLGTIYKYFSSKQDMVFTVIDESLEKLNDRIKMHVKGLEDPKEIFRKVFWATMDFYDHNNGVAITGFITVPTKTWMEKKTYRRDSTGKVLAEILDNVKKKGGINPEINIRTLNHLYYMFCQRHVLVWYYHGKKWKLADKISDFYELFWRIIRP